MTLNDELGKIDSGLPSRSPACFDCTRGPEIGEAHEQLQLTPLIGQIETTAAIREERKIPDDLAVVGGKWELEGSWYWYVPCTKDQCVAPDRVDAAGAGRRGGSRLGNQGSIRQVNSSLLLVHCCRSVAAVLILIFSTLLAVQSDCACQVQMVAFCFCLAVEVPFLMV